MSSQVQILFKNIHKDNSYTLKVHKEGGGYKQAEKALSMSKDDIIDEVKKANIRGRGGAGFPAGLKWSFIPKDDRDKYLVCNADEGEPGTCKDRDIMRYVPHLLIEGMIIAAFAVGAERGYIYIRGEFVREAQILNDAIKEAYDAGILGRNIFGKKGVHFDLAVHRGAGAYVCGEETGLIESLEGKKGQPRVKPPFPANIGLWGGPTVINNVETLASVPSIIENGGDWYGNLGVEKSSGTKIFSISGHVNKPGNYEVELGIPMKTLIEEYAGGVRGGWDNLKGVIPGGSSSPILTKDVCETITMDYDAIAKAGSMLGSGAMIVIDKSICIVKAIERLSRFYRYDNDPDRKRTGGRKRYRSLAEYRQ